MPCLTVSTARFSQERVCSASATDAVRLRSTRTNPLWQVSGLTAHRRSISILCAKPARPFPSSVVPISDALVLPSARRPKAEREKRVRRHSTPNDGPRRFQDEVRPQTRRPRARRSVIARWTAFITTRPSTRPSKARAMTTTTATTTRLFSNTRHHPHHQSTWQQQHLRRRWQRRRRRSKQSMRRFRSD